MALVSLTIQSSRTGYASRLISGVRYHMLSRYPDQARSRKGHALTGVVFLIFGVFMALIGSVTGAFIGFVLGCALFLPAFLFSHSRFKKYESAISWIASLGSLS